MFPHRVREDVPSVGERAQKTGKEGVTNSKDPNGKLSLKEGVQSQNYWRLGGGGEERTETNGRGDRTSGGHVPLFPYHLPSLSPAPPLKSWAVS